MATMIFKKCAFVKCVFASILTFYAPVNITAGKFFRRANPLRGGLGLGTRDICGPCEIA